MLETLQKQYTYEIIDYARWQSKIKARKTFFGQVKYYIGKSVCIFWIQKIVMSIKNVFAPNYQNEQLNKNVKFILQTLGVYSDVDEYYWRIMV